ncbi:hypothetical protein JCM8097_002479 [Rhodosporidiobolus ruineniae]
MLSRLPVELLRLIIREAAPLEYRSSTYKDRRSTLRSLCLVDKRCWAVAEPMLDEVLRLEASTDANDDEQREFKLAGAHAHHLTRIQVLALASRGYLSGLTLPASILSCTSLSLLDIGGADVRLGELASLPSLRRLITWDCCIEIDPFRPLKHLEEFSLVFSDVHCRTHTVATVFTPAYLPALRSLVPCSGGAPGGARADLSPRSFKDHLLVFGVFLDDVWQYSREDLQLDAVVVLAALDEPFILSLSSLPANLAVLISRSEGADGRCWSPSNAKNALVTLLSSLQHLHSAGSTRLHTLSLPRALLDPPFSTFDGLSEARERIIKQCEEWKVVVLDGDDCLDIDSCMPEAFMEYRREVKAREDVSVGE